MQEPTTPMQRFAASILRGARDIGLLAVRACLGVILVAHGLRRWLVIGIENEIGRLTALDMPTPDWFTWGSVVFEVVGGTLLVFGLGTVLIGGLVVVQQALVISYLKLDNGLYLANGGFEYNLALAALGLIPLLYGGGRLAVDHLFVRRPQDEPTPLIELADAPAPAPVPPAMVNLPPTEAPLADPAPPVDDQPPAPAAEAPINNAAPEDAAEEQPAPPKPRPRTRKRTPSPRAPSPADPETPPTEPKAGATTPRKPSPRTRKTTAKPHSKHTGNTQQTYEGDVQE